MIWKKINSMKKIVKILLALLLLFIAMLFAIPVLFKDKVVEIIQTQINENVNADVSFSNAKLSLISSFPDLTVGLYDLKVVNKAPFEGEELLSFEALTLGVDLMSAISGDEIVVNEVILDNANINVLIDKEGNANFDIAKESEAEEEETEEQSEEAEGGFKMALDHYEIKNLNLVYDDKMYVTYLSLANLNHSGSGDFTSDLFDLSTVTSIEAINCKYDDVAYVENVSLDWSADLSMNMTESKYSFIKNELKLNELVTKIDGSIAMPEEAIDFDLKIDAPNQDFKGLFSLIPSAYSSDMAGIETSGKFSLLTILKGEFTDYKYPGYQVDLTVENGSVHYADLPESITDIQVDFHVNNKTGHDDDLQVNLKQFYALFGKYVLDASLKYDHPITNPKVAMSVQTQIDLAHLKDFIELEDQEEYTGMITANLKASGYLNDLEEEKYEDFQAEGEVNILDFSYKAQDMVPTTISSAYFEFTPKSFILNTLEGKVGQSDFKANGGIDNILSYALRDELLKGSFDLHSNSFDLNEWMEEEGADAEESVESVDTTTYDIYEVPKNLDFRISASIGEILYEDIEMKEAKGTLLVKEGRVKFVKSEMKMLGGKTKFNGFYSTEDMDNPKTGFYMAIENFDIPTTYKTFNSVQKLAPGAQFMEGDFSTQISFASNLLYNYDLDLNTISGKGNLTSKAVKLKNAPTFKKIADVVKYEKLNDVEFKNVNINYEFKDGKVVVEPFDVKMGESDLSISGENGFDQTINYKMVLTMPTSMLGGSASSVVKDFSSELSKITGKQSDIGSHINFNIVAKGPYDSPKVSVHPAGTHGKASDVIDDIKEEVKEAVTEVIEETVDKAKEQAIAEAEKQAAKLKLEVKKGADIIRAEGKKQAAAFKKKGYQEADNLVAKAKSPLAKATAKKTAAQMKKETDKKANQIIQKANKEADEKERLAGEKADKLIEEAKKK